MKTINWSGYEWILQERWGLIHPKKRWMWYDPTATSIDNNGYLHLKTQYNPKYFVEGPDGPDSNFPTTSNCGVGLVSCTTRFKYGTFEIEAKLPKGKHLWPAFWLWGWDTWPPEIDVLEAYSNKFGNYFSLNFKSIFGNPGAYKYGGFSIWKTIATMHWRTGPSTRSDVGSTKFWGLKNPANRFVKYKLEWLPNVINVYYDDNLTMSVTDPAILADMNTQDMNVIINNGLVQEHLDTNSDFVVRYFKYSPL